MSLGFTPQPLLSDRSRARETPHLPGVAGVYTPAFVERLNNSRGYSSLSRVAGVYTPAFVERTTKGGAQSRCGASVAGVYTPAFVERSFLRLSRSCDNGVAGVYTPAFVERTKSSWGSPQQSRVSLGFTPQPLLSERCVKAF